MGREVFGIVVDPLNEATNGFIFGTNTRGVQFESLISGGQALRAGVGGVIMNDAWDQAWQSEARIYEDRWTLEMSIPFKSLRYAEKDSWGINFWRGARKSGEWHTWARSTLEYMVVDIGHVGALEWESKPKKSARNIAIIPYLLNSASKDFDPNSPLDSDVRAGVDAKVALTSSLNLDLTINPDFSQVDVDEQVTNLSTVNLRFPERRLFFLENSDLFSDFGIPPIRPFFSRRIGLDDDGNTIPISYGARISGNLNKDLRMGLMNLQTRSTDIFEAQNYSSFTLHKRLLSKSVLKGYFHNRQTTTVNFSDLKTYNRVAGLEFLYISDDSKWRSSAGLGKSWSTGLSGDDFFYNILLGYNDQNISFYTNFAGVGDNYRADMGFNPRFDHYDSENDTSTKLGYHHGFTRAGYRILPADRSKISSHGFDVTNVFDYTEHGFDLIQNRISIGYTLQWTNASQFEIDFTHEEQGLLFPFAFTDKSPLPVGRYGFNHFSAGYRSNGGNDFSYSLGYRNGGFFNGNRQEYSLTTKYRVPPWGNFSMNFVYNTLDFPDEYGEVELFLIGPKLEFNFSRSLFWTTFLQYNTQRDNFNINSRVQWRFKPMSDLFFVYSDNYATDIWGPKDRALVIKMNYWMNL